MKYRNNHEKGIVMTQETERAFNKVYKKYGFSEAYANAYPAHCNASFAREMFMEGWQARARLGKGEVDTHHPVFAFLLGEGNLEGRGFGDEPPVDDKTRRRIPFWWRKHLRDALFAKPVEVGELTQLLADIEAKGLFWQHAAQAILSRYNVTLKEEANDSR